MHQGSGHPATQFMSSRVRPIARGECTKTDGDVEKMNATTENSEPLQRAACSYVAKGWSVIPLQRGSKVPAIKWQRYQKARANIGDVARWFRRWPMANIGIVTGEISNLLVLDIDPQHGGVESLGRLEAKSGKLPITVRAATGGGGLHFYFAHPGEFVPNRVGVAPGVDLRGDGGYVVAPPSRHPSGRYYNWVANCSPDEMTPASAPRWLFAGYVNARMGHTLDHWRSLLREGVAEGERNSTVASLSGHLLWHGVDPDVVLQLLLAWNRCCCRPPLDDAEVSQVVRSISHRHSGLTRWGP